MATNKTTHSKKLHKAKKIEQKKPLSVLTSAPPAGPVPIPYPSRG